ncbi:MAG: peptidoglycan-binding protein [Alphaproteobacteria bacterium]|nr:peptidoglycan-binding protein [Alphaproteobacteria bacterium]
MKKIVLAGLTMAFLAGCSSTPLNDAAAPSDAKAGESVDRSSTDNLGLDLLRSDSLLTQRSIYFDFDKFEVKPEYLDVVNAHAQYAADHPGVKMTLKGHADYRGSHEYNLALGQKRSVSVKDVMNTSGANDAQIETVSYGEEEANQNCQGDECSQDRRVDISYEVE